MATNYSEKLKFLISFILTLIYYIQRHILFITVVHVKIITLYQMTSTISANYSKIVHFTYFIKKFHVCYFFLFFFFFTFLSFWNNLIKVELNCQQKTLFSNFFFRYTEGIWNNFVCRERRTERKKQNFFLQKNPNIKNGIVCGTCGNVWFILS